MSRRLPAGAVLVACFAGLLGPALCGADPWPQMRGPRRDGRSAELGIFTSWPTDGPEELWRAPLGDGYSGVVVAGGRVVTMYGREGQEWLAAFDTRNGDEIWRVRVDHNFRSQYGGGPRSTPAIHRGLVYAVGAQAQMVAVELETGKERWRRDLRREFGARIPGYGVATSPLIEGDQVVVDAAGKRGHGLIAFEPETGEVIWHALNHRPAYSAPLAVTIGEVRQVIAFTAHGLVAVGSGDGKLLWRVPWTTELDVNAAMPVFVPSSGVFVSSGRGTGSALVQVVAEAGGFKPYQIWRGRIMKNDYHASVLDRRHLYGFDGSVLKAVEALTGNQAWRARAGGYSRGAVIWADGQLLVAGGQGKVGLVEATPDGFRHRGHGKVLEGPCWNSPALSDGVFYVRDPRTLVALRVGDPSAGPTGGS